MLKVFVIDSTEKLLYYNVVAKYIDNADVETKSFDRAISKISKKSYDLILVSRAPGKYDLYDVADFIKNSRVNKKAEIIILEDNPTVATKFVGILRGRRVHRFKSNQFDALDSLIGRVSS